MELDDLPDIILIPGALVVLFVMGVVLITVVILSMFLWGSWKAKVNWWLEEMGW